jgi:hypothetical protein
MSRNLDYVQFGAQLSLEGLDESTKEEIINVLVDSDLEIGEAPGSEEYHVNTSE